MFIQISCAQDNRLFALDDKGEIWVLEKDMKDFSPGGPKSVWRNIPLPDAQPMNLEAVLKAAVAQMKEAK